MTCNWRDLKKFQNLKECEKPGLPADERFRRWIIEDILQWGQRPYSYVTLFLLALSTNPKTIVELGTGLGGSATVFTAAARLTDGKVFTVDKCGPEDDNNAYTRDLLARDVEDGYLEFIQGDSVDQGKKWDKSPIDFMFFDAQHNHDGVQEEFEAWHPHMHPRTLMTIHDTMCDGTPTDIYDACEEYAERYKKTCYHLDTHAGLALIVPWRREN